MWLFKKCANCTDVKLVKRFETSQQYEQTVKYVKELIEKKGFILTDGNCSIDRLKSEDGFWVDDIIYHTVQCPKCGRIFTCSADTYHGRGSFRKGK